MSTYIFDNAAPQAGQRFASLEALYDLWTIRHLEATGVGPGWRCWEVGAGGGSIARWLTERCGPTGHVLVTDLDPRYLVEPALIGDDHPTVEIQRHDIGTDPLPDQRFDLIHARLVLVHVPAREQAVERMVTALRPGGWLVIEDLDVTLIDDAFPTAGAEASALFRKMRGAQYRLTADRSGDGALTWGRRMFQCLREKDLINVDMEGYVALRQGGSAGAALMRANFEQIRQEAITAGLVTGEEVERMLALLDDPDFVGSGGVLFTAWGSRAGAASQIGAAP